MLLSAAVEKKEEDKKPLTSSEATQKPSDKIENAHAAGDGAIAKTDEEITKATDADKDSQAY